MYGVLCKNFKDFFSFFNGADFLGKIYLFTEILVI